ncbi:uncharacterized protein LOC129313566 isoform X1 [Prosopis cineraria]|uniref:uncharacterized protein LOC129313566 isoform X1 n=1 Tax=Prosopis cineraria TaxID=364024 RepID=UPI0024101721|nr:uncharacterized protein LOC129313566 isoform X1 [Prosopis cineraria]
MDEVMTMADINAATQSTPSAATPTSLLPSNFPLLSAFLSFALAQFLKIFTTWYKERRWDSKRMLDSGGMPSSHSATVSALAAAIGLQEGTGSPAFAVAVVLACVVMYDATGVRLHAGRQAELLNQIVCELPPEHPLSTVRPLRDSLGCCRCFIRLFYSHFDEDLQLGCYLNYTYYHATKCHCMALLKENTIERATLL